MSADTKPAFPALVALAFPLCFGLLSCATVDIARHDIHFAGRDWERVASPEPIGPGPNLFRKANVYLDAEGRLVLETGRDSEGWSSAGIFLAESLGYGTYELRLAPLEKEFDPLTVFGFYTWDRDPAFANREIDIEMARWGIEEAPNLNFTVQPAQEGSERGAAFPIATAGLRGTLRFTWYPDSVDFSATFGEASVRWRFPSPSLKHLQGTAFAVPPAGAEKLGLNLWLFRGREPATADRIVIEDFLFFPATP